MRIINLYQETLGIVSDCCKVSKEKIISSKKEKWVNVVKITDASTIETTTVIMTGKTV